MRPHVVNTVPATPRRLEIPTRVQYEDAVIADAEAGGHFTATRKVGRGQYHTERAETLSEAIRTAERMAGEVTDGKHVMVYAIGSTGRQVYVGSWVPAEGWVERTR